MNSDPPHTLTAWAAHLLPLAQQNLERDGRLAPVAFVFGPAGMLATVVLDFSSPRGKAASLRHVRALVRQAAGAILLAEAWVRQRPEDAARREAVLLEIAGADGTHEAWLVPFTRGPDGVIAWAPRETSTEFRGLLGEPRRFDA